MHALPSLTSTTPHVATRFGFVALAITAGALGVAPGAAAVVATASIAAWIDFRTARIPDQWVYIALVPTCVVVATGSAGLGAVVAGAAVLAVPLLVFHLASPQAMGFGDVKLAVPLGATVGMLDPALGLVALCVASAVTAAVGLASRRSALAFGPGLVIGTSAALAASSVLGGG